MFLGMSGQYGPCLHESLEEAIQITIISQKYDLSLNLISRWLLR